MWIVEVIKNGRIEVYKVAKGTLELFIVSMFTCQMAEGFVYSVTIKGEQNG